MSICIISRFAFAGRFTGGGVPVTLCCLALSPYETVQRRRPVRIPSRSIKSRPLAGTRQGVYFFMDLEGFEPLTSRMRTERSPN